MYLPQYEKAFGSAFLTIDLPNHGFNTERDPNNSYSYSQNYVLKRTHWKALDYEEQRCGHEGNAGSTTKCITKYLEREIGCSMGLLGSSPTLTRFGCERFNLNYILTSTSTTGYFLFQVQSYRAGDQI